MASSMASLVPEPMEKCALALASPRSTLLPMTQRLLRIIGKLRQIERFVGTGGPEEPSEDLLHERGGFSLALLAGPARSKFGIGLEHPGRAPRLVLIGMGDERPPFRLLEDEGEGVERLGRAHPGELVGRRSTSGWKCSLRSEAAVDAVGHDHEIRIREQALVIVDLVTQPDAEFLRAVLQDQEQGAARAAAEAVAADPVLGSLKWIAMSSQ